MIQRIILELDDREKEELRLLLEKLTRQTDTVEIKLNNYLRSIARTIIKDMDRWEAEHKERW